MTVQDDVKHLENVFRLKEVYRFSQVQERKESSAEHSWSCLVVADILLNYVKQPINRLRVYELLTYHDLVEVEAGDVGAFSGHGKEEKLRQEQEAAHTLAKRLPPSIAQKFLVCFTEYTEEKTREARFAHLVDGIEADAFYGMYPPKKAVVSAEEYDRKRAKHLKAFPEIKPIYDEIKRLRIKEGIIIE